MKGTGILCSLLVVGLALEGADKVSLRAAVKNGLRLSESLQTQIWEEETARLSRETAERKKWFAIDAAASYMYRSEQMEIVFPSTTLGTGLVIPGKALWAGSRNNYDFKASLTQPIYLGGILRLSERREEINAAAERETTRMKRIEAAMKIRTSYYTFRVLLDRRQSLSYLAEIIDLHSKKLENLVQEELARRSDLLETLTQKEEIRMNIGDLEQLIANECILFRRVSGYDPFEIEDPPEESEIVADEALRRFRQEHPLLRGLADKLRLLEVQKKIVAGRALPQIAGFAEFHYARPGIDFFKNQWSPYFQGGINLALPVFSWNQNRRDRALVDIQTQKLMIQRDGFVADGEKNIRQLYERKKSLDAKLANLETLILYSDEDARLKEKLFEENQISNSDYLSALIRRERYASMKKELTLERGLLKTVIRSATGASEEEP